MEVAIRQSFFVSVPNQIYICPKGKKKVILQLKLNHFNV